MKHQTIVQELVEKKASYQIDPGEAYEQDDGTIILPVTIDASPKPQEVTCSIAPDSPKVRLAIKDPVSFDPGTPVSGPAIQSGAKVVKQEGLEITLDKPVLSEIGTGESATPVEAGDFTLSFAKPKGKYPMFHIVARPKIDGSRVQWFIGIGEANGTIEGEPLTPLKSLGNRDDDLTQLMGVMHLS